MSVSGTKADNPTAPAFVSYWSITDIDTHRNAVRFSLVAHHGPIRPMSLILFSLAGSGATTMTSPSRGRTPSIARMFWPWVTTTSVPGPRHAPIVARAPAVSASRVAFNTKALLKVGASSTGPMFINSAVCRQRHHWELTILPTLTRCVRKRSPRARASARPCPLRLRWVAQHRAYSRLDRRPGPAPRHGGSAQHDRRRAARSMRRRCRRRNWPRCLPA